MDPDFTIETDRLILRRYRSDDLDEHVAILSNWDVTRWLSDNIPYPYSRKAGEQFIEDAKANFDEGDQICFSVVEKATNRHVGGIKLFSIKNEACELGYWLGPDFWARGFATEIVDAVINWLGQKTQVKTLYAQTADENKASRKLLEKVGFIHSGTPPQEISRCGHGAGCSEYYVLKINPEEGK